MDEREGAEYAASMILRARDCVRRYKMHAGGNGKRFMILGSLRERENRTGRPTTVTEMACATGLALPNVSRLLKPLEEEGLLRRERQGRTVHVVITPAGDALLAARKQDFVRDIGIALGALTDEERSSFLTCCEKLLMRLEEHLQKQETGGSAC